MTYNALGPRSGDRRSSARARPLDDTVLPSGVGAGFWEQSAVLILLGGCGVIPCVFTTSTDDVFYMPKLVGLWVVLALLSWVVAASVLKDRSRNRLRLIGVVDLPLLAFIFLNVCALAWSGDDHQSLFGERLQHQGVLTMLLYIAFFYLARYLICDGRRMFLLFASVTAGATLVSAYAIIQKLGLDPIWKGYLPSGRVFSSIGQPNALAAYLVLCIPITAAFALRKSGFRRYVAIGGLTLMSGALLLSYSRGGYLGIVVTALVFGYQLKEARRRGRTDPRLYIGMATVVSVLVVVVEPLRSVITRAWHRALSVGNVTSDESISNHLALWRVAVRIIESHPLVGTGPETFPEVFPRYSHEVLPASQVTYFDQFRVESPHDQLLAVGSGAGIPAAIAYVSVLVGSIYVLFQTLRRSADAAVRLSVLAIVAAGVGHIVTDSFMSAEVTGSWLFWTLLGAGLGLASSSR
jgi:O-Antigen ligase